MDNVSNDVELSRKHLKIKTHTTVTLCCIGEQTKKQLQNLNLKCVRVHVEQQEISSLYCSQISS